MERDTDEPPVDRGERRERGGGEERGMGGPCASCTVILSLLHALELKSIVCAYIVNSKQLHICIIVRVLCFKKYFTE